MSQNGLKGKLIESMSRLASGVSVVLTDVDERPWGLTISAFCSISVDPPLIMISLANKTASAKAIKRNNKFGVSLLGEDKIDIAKAGAKAGQLKFFESYVEFDRNRGIYFVKDSLAHIDCDVYKTILAGDHTIFIGSVNDVVLGDLKNPLIYNQRQFGSFSDAAHA